MWLMRRHHKWVLRDICFFLSNTDPKSSCSRKYKFAPVENRELLLTPQSPLFSRPFHQSVCIGTSLGITRAVWSELPLTCWRSFISHPAAWRDIDEGRSYIYIYISQRGEYFTSATPTARIFDSASLFLFFSFARGELMALCTVGCVFWMSV